MNGGGLGPRQLLARIDHLPTLLAALLCLHGLWRWPLWEDELFTWGVATDLPLNRVFELAAKDRHPPLYFLLTALIARIGNSDAMLRLPSAVAAIGAVALVVHVGRRHLGVGAVAAWMLPLLPFVLVYGSMARSYALLLVLGAGLLAASFLTVRRAAVAVAVLGVLGVHTHYAMALPIAAAVVVVALRGWAEARPGERMRGVLPAVGAVVAMGVCFIPWGMVAAGQAARESTQGVRYSVLAWALWPIARFVPHVAWPMLALALLGVGWVVKGISGPSAAGPSLRLVLLPWILAAAVLPLYASTRGATATKLYVFAPLLPLFVLLAAVALTRLTAGLAARLPAGAAPFRDLIVAAPLLLFVLPDTVTVLALPAVPLELGLVMSGSRDVRRDAELFNSVDPTLFDRAIDDRTWTPYSRYLPRPLPGTQKMRAWYGWRRTEGAEAQAISEGVQDRGCFFRRSFLSLVYVTDPMWCMALREGITTVAQEDGYGPFLLQAAEFARERGDTAAAEGLARKAVGRMGPSGEPSLFLARRQLERGDADAALATVERGMSLSKRWGDEARVAQLYELAGVASEQKGDADGVATAKAGVTCARAEQVPLTLCGTWAESLWPVAEVTPRRGGR
ncbi:MAG: hypothetical protein V4850_10355 [Myxococcota bacterium]